MDVAGSQSNYSRELRVLNEGTAARVGQPTADGPEWISISGSKRE